MISYIPADEQRAIRSEMEQAKRILQQVFLRLNPLDRADERVVRTEQVLSALERVLWTMTSGPGRLGPPVKVRAVLTPPPDLGLHPATELRDIRGSFSPKRESARPETRVEKGVRSARA